MSFCWLKFCCRVYAWLKELAPAGKAASQPRSLVPAEENSFSGVSSQAAPHKRSSRKSVGGSALRVLSANHQTDASWEGTETSRPLSRTAMAARRISCMPPPAPPTASRAPHRPPPTPRGAAGESGAKRIAVQQAAVPVMPAFEGSQNNLAGHTAESSSYNVTAAASSAVSDRHSYAEPSGQAESELALTAGHVLALAASAGSDWKAKVGMFVSMQQLLQHASNQSLSESSEKLVQLLLEHIGDAHFKVAHAALDAMQAGLYHHPDLLELALDRLMPLLSHRITDPKEAIRAAALRCLQSALELYPLEVCLPQLTRSLQAVKAAKGRAALLEVFTANCGQAVTTAAALPALRLWVGQVGVLVGDRNAEIRRAACQALHLVYTRMDGPTLLTHIAHASPPEQMTLKRALTPMLPNLDAQLVPYSHSRAGQSVHRPATAPSASHPPPTPLDPPAQAPPNFLGDVTDTASDQCQSEASSQPQQLPLASELSLSSTDNSSFALEARSQGQQAADSSNQSRHDFASDILHQRDAVTLGDRLVDNMQQPVIDERQEPTNGLKGSRASSARQQSLLNQQQQHNGQLRDSSAGSVWPGRVSVDTAGSVRRTVITVAELQATVQPEGASAQRAFQDDRMTGRLTSSASPSASEQEGEPARLGSHAHLSRSQLGVFASQSDLQLQSNALQQRGSAAESHQQALPQQVAVTSLHVPDRALRDSPALNSARDRANSPLPEGKSHSPASQLIAVRRSQDTDAVLQSHPAAQEAALLSAVQDVQHASDDNATAAVQALQLQVCSTAALALQACLPQVVAVLLPLLANSTWQTQQAALMAVKGVASQSSPALGPWLPALVPALLDAASHPRPEVCMAADEGLGALLLQQPPAMCLPLLKANLPAQGTVNTPTCPPTPLIHASVKNIGRMVQRMSSADLLPELQSPDLLPGLFEAFDHHSADVRKAVTMCLMYMWQVMGDNLKPFLAGLRVSKIKLVTAYVEQAQSQRRRL